MDYGKARSQGHLPDSPDGAVILESPGLSSRPTDPHAVLLPALRILYRTICVRKGYKDHCTDSATIRHSPYYILRRSVARSSFQGSAVAQPLHSCMVVYNNSLQSSGNTKGSDSTCTTGAYASEGSSTDDWDVGSYQATSPYRTITLPI